MIERRPPARALRALGLTLALYVGARVSVLVWIEGVAPTRITAHSIARGADVAREGGTRVGNAAGVAPGSVEASLAHFTEAPPHASQHDYAAAARWTFPARTQPRAVARTGSTHATIAEALPPLPSVRTHANESDVGKGMVAVPADITPGVAAIPTSARRRFSGSAWLLARSGSGASATFAPGGSLGGSQAGARLIWRPLPGPAFLTLRGSAALAVRDREIAPGVGISRGSAGLILEQRFSLDGTRPSETAIVGYAGASEVTAPLGFKLDGYLQAGVVGLKRRALFVDGAVRAERSIATIGPARLGIGGGLWGAAQPGASRADVGPQAVLHLPAFAHGARLSAEYRFRLAGDARPPSGPSLTLGVDF